MAQFRPMLARHDLTEQQWRVIRVLAQYGRLDASEFGERAFILGPSLTRITRTLEERDVISRHKDEADGRRTLVELEDSGWRIIADIYPESTKICAYIEAEFGAERTRTLLTLLDELASLPSEHPGRGEQR